VLDWKNKAIDLLNQPGFSVADQGPLHGDIRAFKIRRDESLTLFIDTEAVRGRHFPARAIPPGMARINPDNVKIDNPSGAKADLSAVIATTRTERGNEVRETARVHELTVALPGAGPVAHTIEWLENLPSHHCWPNMIESVEGRKQTPEQAPQQFSKSPATGSTSLGRVLDEMTGRCHDRAASSTKAHQTN
jgi:hypothetical protein